MVVEIEKESLELAGLETESSWCLIVERLRGGKR